MSENQRLQSHNFQLQNQMVRYEEMLTKMNQEYEKLMYHSNKNDQIILQLKTELSDIKASTSTKIATLDSQLKVSIIT